MKTLHFAININAPKEKIWHTALNLGHGVDHIMGRVHVKGSDFAFAMLKR